MILFISIIAILSSCGNKEEVVDQSEITEQEEQELIEQIEEEADSLDTNQVTESEEPETDQDVKDTSIEKHIQTNGSSKTTIEQKKQETTTKSNTKENSKTEKKSVNKDKDSTKKNSEDKSPSSKQKNNTETKKKNTTQSSTNQVTKEQEKKPEKVEQSVTVSVSIPSGVSGGSGLSATKVTINEGDSVLDATLKAGVSVDYTGSGATAYIRGINGLKEFDEGPMSGWLVKVDGVMISQSAGSYVVNNNQKIEWIYTTDYTK